MLCIVNTHSIPHRTSAPWSRCPEGNVSATIRLHHAQADILCGCFATRTFNVFEIEFVRNVYARTQNLGLVYLHHSCVQMYGKQLIHTQIFSCAQVDYIMSYFCWSNIIKINIHILLYKNLLIEGCLSVCSYKWYSMWSRYSSACCVYRGCRFMKKRHCRPRVD